MLLASLSLLLHLGTAAAAAPPAGDPSALPRPPAADAAPVPAPAGVADYRALALGQSPRLAAAHARWQAALRAERPAGALPEPSLSVAAYVQAVETRVGPQRGRVSLQQPLPPPGSRPARRAGASARAAAAAAAVEAVALDTTAEVERRYWALWALRATRETHRAHLDVLDGMSATLRARLEVGAATLADLQQVDLSRARLADAIATMDAREQAAGAWLRAAAALDAATPLATDAPPPAPVVPDAPLAELLAAAQDHPRNRAAAARADEATAAMRLARAQRRPGLRVGVDWIPTGPAAMPDVDDSGKDALAVGLGVDLPLWQGAHRAAVDAGRAGASAAAADAAGTALELGAALADAHARVLDNARRTDVIETTLLPAAEASYASLLGRYAVGEATVAQVLLAQRDLLALQIDADEARAAWATAWAALAAQCGRIPAAHPHAPAED